MLLVLVNIWAKKTSLRKFLKMLKWVRNTLVKFLFGGKNAKKKLASLGCWTAIGTQYDAKYAQKIIDQNAKNEKQENNRQKCQMPEKKTTKRPNAFTFSKKTVQQMFLKLLK